MLSSASDKANVFAKSFSKNSNLVDLDIFLLVFPSRTSLKLHNSRLVIPVVVLKNCEPEFLYILVELFSVFLKNLVFQIVGRSRWWSMHSRVLAKGLRLKAATLLVFFLWLQNCFSGSQHDFRSFRSTADLPTDVSARIAGALNRCGAPQAVALDIALDI